MTLPGSPRLPRSCLAQHTRSATTSPEMEALRRRAWHEQGVASLPIQDITDSWLRQAVINEVEINAIRRACWTASLVARARGVRWLSDPPAGRGIAHE